MSYVKAYAYAHVKEFSRSVLEFRDQNRHFDIYSTQ